MIKQWSVGNFKSIRERVDIPFAPLTLFVGQNSAGKSTVIQSMLFTAQTIQSNVTARSVILNGRIIRLGAFDDIRANNSNEDSVTVAFELGKPNYESENPDFTPRMRFYSTPDIHEQMLIVGSSFTFSAGSSGDRSQELQLQPRIEKGSVKGTSKNQFMNVAELNG